jgi:hypothetical protein
MGAAATAQGTWVIVGMGEQGLVNFSTAHHLSICLHQGVSNRVEGYTKAYIH